MKLTEKQLADAIEFVRANVRKYQQPMPHTVARRKKLEKGRKK